jgi:hypothetical protein
MATKKSSSKSDEKTSRCWPGFEPVPGKGEHEQGSCRKKPASRNGGKEVDRETSRKKQVAAGGKRGEQAKSKSPNAAERRSVSKTAKKSTSASKTKSSSKTKSTSKSHAKAA